MELVKDAKIELRPSPTSEAWRAGLEHYWADEYTEAIAKFEEVETAFPAHSEAPNLIRLSHQAQKDGKEKQPPSNAGLVAGLVVGGLLGVIIAAILIVRRGRVRSAPSPRRRPVTRRRPPGYPAPPPGYPPPPQAQQPLPMYGRIQQPQQAQQAQQPQMYGRVAPGQPAAASIPRTVAIQGGIAPTAFGSLSVGSVTCTRGAARRPAVRADRDRHHRRPPARRRPRPGQRSPRLGQARLDRPRQRRAGRDRPEHDQRDLHQRRRARPDHALAAARRRRRHRRRARLPEPPGQVRLTTR